MREMTWYPVQLERNDRIKFVLVQQQNRNLRRCRIRTVTFK